MVDAVISSVTTSNLIRATAGQASRASEKVKEAPQAPYVSPYIGVDRQSQKVVLQIRNGDTGKVIEQIPSSPTLDEQENATKKTSVVQAQSQSQQAADTTPQPQQAQPQSSGQSTPAASAASFGAFAKQVASIQSGGSTGSTVSISA